MNVITPEDNKKLLALLAEARARGIPLPADTQLPDVVDDKWNVDENGYFIARTGKRFKPRPELEGFINNTARFSLLRSGRGGGKALWVETPILTQNRGWQTMGSLIVGDVVFSERGEPCSVIFKSDVMFDHKCYKVSFSDASEIVADAGHLWFTQNKKERNAEVKSVGKTRTTEEMIPRAEIGRRREKNYSIATCKPLQYEEKELPLHPYILGAWLGDGSSRAARFTTADAEILEILSSFGVKHKKVPGCNYDYGIFFPNTENTRNPTTGRMESNPRNLASILKKMGLIMNKHVPRIYLEASVQQRLLLLQGLMDTDGTVDKRGHCSYTTISGALFRCVLELCLGLGIKAGYFVDRAYIYYKDGTKKDCGDCYTIYINTELPVFKLSRKLNRLLSGKKQAKRHENRFIYSIEEVESVPVQCIEVDSESHLYLAGTNLIATHNTSSGAQKALRKIMAGKSGGVMSPDFENFRNSTWVELKEWIPWDMVVPRQRYRRSDSWEAIRPFTMVFLNGAKMYCKGLKDPESARGGNWNWFWYDEGRRDPSGLGWKNAVSAVRVGENPQAWCTTTPAYSQHWTSTFFSGELTHELLRLLDDLGISKTQELFAVFETSIERNKPNLDPMFYASILATYPKGYLRAREVEGRIADEQESLGDRTWFRDKILKESPDWISQQVRFWDLAGTEDKMVAGKKKNDPDETMGSLVGVDKSADNFCLQDQVGGRWKWETIKDMVVAVGERDGQEVKICFEQEPASGGKNQVAELINHIKSKLPEWDVSGLEAKKLGDRVLAANTWFGEAAKGRWWMLEGLWNNEFLNQLDFFPNEAIHDDRITSVTGARHKLAPIRKWRKIGFLHMGMNFKKEAKPTLSETVNTP